jgi:predicted nuclease of predicted toxin-antitoxin system
LRLLLDEAIEENVTDVLQALGHEADHVVRLGLAGASDFDLVEVAKTYDVFVTLDLHRQEAEWLAVNSAIVRGEVKVLRVRLPKRPQNVLLDTVRSLTYRMESWVAEFAGGKSLVTISGLGVVERSRTSEEVAEMLARFRADRGTD